MRVVLNAAVNSSCCLVSDCLNLAEIICPHFNRCFQKFFVLGLWCLVGRNGKFIYRDSSPLTLSWYTEVCVFLIENIALRLFLFRDFDQCQAVLGVDMASAQLQNRCRIVFRVVVACLAWDFGVIMILLFLNLAGMFRWLLLNRLELLELGLVHDFLDRSHRLQVQVRDLFLFLGLVGR